MQLEWVFCRSPLEEIAKCEYLQPPVSRPSISTDEYDYADETVVYRSALAMDDDDESAEPFDPPPEAMRIMRQPAQRDIE